MRRSEFLAVTGCDVDTYKNWRHREHLPFSAKLPEGKHSNFSILDAFKMRLALDLTEGLGLTPGSAYWFVFYAYNEICRAGLTVRNMLPLREAAEADIWIAHIRDRDGGSPDFRVLANGFDRSLFDRDASRVTLVNASGAARYVLAKADALGLSDE